MVNLVVFNQLKSLMDKLVFYKEATEKAASDINPEKAMPELFKYLKSVMPLNAMVNFVFDPETNLVRIRSMRTGSFSIQPDKWITISESSKTFFNWQYERNVLNVDDLCKTPLNDGILSFFNKKLNKNLGSAILIRMLFEDKKIGFSGLYAEGFNRYSDEHLGLVEVLSKTLSFVSHNAMAYYDNLKRFENLDEENRFLHREIKRISSSPLIGSETGLKNIVESIKKLSSVDSHVLILGESGVGKELVANAIQENSKRCNGPYIKVNCGAITNTLVDSELFGHEKGAFTGADRTQKGRFERAHKGTIFLDEIGELPMAAQVRLLRVLQNKEIERVGGKTTIPVDTRIIAATHGDLPAMIKSGDFREDLYYRLNVFPVTVPPLRHRREDIPSLANHFIEKFSRRMNIKRMPKIKDGDLTGLHKHEWPGNIRELENLIERSIIINPEGPLEFKSLLNIPSTRHEDRKIESLDFVIKNHIIQALALSGGKISGSDGAAVLLGIHPNTLRARMDKLNITYKQANIKTSDQKLK
jgi:transcriptional regulator with GAF, ATPase, and Fis domain